MKARSPDFDFTDSPILWNSNRAFAHGWNAASLALPYLEPFLNRVMTRVIADINALGSRVSAQDRALREELRIFIQQEGNHFRIHEGFNNHIRKHYPGMEPLEMRLKSYFETLLKARSLRYLTAFCESFETLGPIYAKLWLDDFDEKLSGSDPTVLTMWKWHWAEEFEHRVSCFNAYQRYRPSYLHRIYMLFHTLRTLKRYQHAFLKHMLESDRQKMTPEERRHSLRNERRENREMLWRFARPILTVLLPFYTPARRSEPRNYRAFVARLDGS